VLLLCCCCAVAVLLLCCCSAVALLCSALLSAAALYAQAAATPRTQAEALASMFDMEGIDSLLDGGTQAAPKLGYFVELTLRDAEGNEVLKVTGESEAGTPLDDQMAFKIPPDMKQQLLPDEACAHGALHAALNGGEDKPWCRRNTVERQCNNPV
jgi:hypothetical protein